MNAQTFQVLISSVLLLALQATAAETSEPLQWRNEMGRILYRYTDSYPYVDEENESSLAATLRATGRTSDDRQVEIEFEVANTGRRRLVLYNPGFNEFAPAAGEIAAFDMDGAYEHPLNWPPWGDRTNQDDWVKLEPGQRFVAKQWVRVPFGKHKIQIIYWRWMLTPRPEAHDKIPSFMPENELGGRTEIMRSNSIEVEVLKPATSPFVSTPTSPTTRPASSR